MRLKKLLCALTLTLVSGYALTSQATSNGAPRTKITISSTSSSIQDKPKKTEIVFNNPPGSTSVNKVEVVPLEEDDESKGGKVAKKTETTTKQLYTAKQTPIETAEPAAAQPPAATEPAAPIAAAPAPAPEPTAAPAAPAPSPMAAVAAEHPKQTVVIFDNETGKVEISPPEAAAASAAPAEPKPEIATQQVVPGAEQRASYVKVQQDKDTFISKSGACVNILDDGTMMPCETAQMPGPVPSSKQQ